MLEKFSKTLAICVLFPLALILNGVSAQNPADDLEQFLFDLIRNNATEDIDYGNFTDKPCELRETSKPNFTAQYQRISEAKCHEYIWEMEKREEQERLNDQCRLYLLHQIKQGIIPDFFFAVNIPVIFGGRAAKPGEYPHMGALGWPAKDPSKKYVYKCGSTLISDRFLVTAAHCSKLSWRANDVIRFKPEIVVLGLENIEENEFDLHGAIKHQKIKRFLPHPDYKSPRKYNDIALIELEEPVVFANNLQPACLSSIKDLSYITSEAALTGWGSTENETSSTKLLTASVDVLESKTCDNLLHKYKNRNWHGFSSSQICAGKLDGGIDSCQGDSGGPLQVKIPLNTTGNMHEIIGVTSFGMKCGKRNRPGIYTRVSSYIDWIEKIVWEEPLLNGSDKKPSLFRPKQNDSKRD